MDCKEIIKLFENNIERVMPLFRWEHKTYTFTIKYVKKIIKNINNIKNKFNNII